MKKSFFLFFALQMALQPLLAQDSIFIWKSSALLSEVPAQFKNESALVLTDRRIHEYTPDSLNGLVVQITQYKRIKVITETGIEQYNKIFLPLNSRDSVLFLKARVISSGGKTTDLPDDKILETEEEGRLYRKFALEGIEKGSEIEYIYILQKPLYFFGLEVFQNSATPTINASLTLVHPEHLGFTIKGYNGMTTALDTIQNGQHIVQVAAENILPLENEKYGENVPYLKNVQYKLSYNFNRSKTERLFSWNELAGNVTVDLTQVAEEDKKAIQLLVTKAITQPNLTDAQKIVQLEEYIKTNFSINESSMGSENKQLAAILNAKVADKEGIVNLFAACFDQLNIPYQVVYPAKRDGFRLDKELENYLLTNDAIFYCPSTNGFLEPANPSFRYPLVHPYMAGTNGIYIKRYKMGEKFTALAVIDSIPMPRYDSSFHNMNITLRLNTTLDSVKIHVQQSFNGYGAAMYRPAFAFMPKTDQDNLLQQIIESSAKTNQITNNKATNTSMTDGATFKPLLIDGDAISAALVEQAGKKLLLKIGDIIGPQVEMYQEKTRQIPPTIEYPHVLDRTIVFTIPKGYTIKNLNDLNMQVEDPAKSAGFVSKYTLQGNQLEVYLHEYYKAVNYPMEYFGVFQKVINAAADFNKIVLVIEKTVAN